MTTKPPSPTAAGINKRLEAIAALSKAWDSIPEVDHSPGVLENVIILLQLDIAGCDELDPQTRARALLWLKQNHPEALTTRPLPFFRGPFRSSAENAYLDQAYAHVWRWAGINDRCGSHTAGDGANLQTARAKFRDIIASFEVPGRGTHYQGDDGDPLNIAPDRRPAFLEYLAAVPPVPRAEPPLPDPDPLPQPQHPSTYNDHQRKVALAEATERARQAAPKLGPATEIIW